MSPTAIPTTGQKAPAPPRSFLQQSLAQDWSAFHPLAATVSVMAVALCLCAGLALGAPQLGAAATAGALPTGFGAYQRLSKLRGAPMLLAAIGMGACGFLGASLSDSALASALVGGLIAMICGLATRFGQAPWWFTLQWSIAFFLAGITPCDLPDAAKRGLAVLAGSGLQALMILASWRWRPFGAGAGESDAIDATPGTGKQTVRQRLDFRYAAGTGLMISSAILLERHLELANGYWVPMTALIILKPRTRDTFARTLQRLTGTLLGAMAATMTAALVRPGGEALAIWIILSAWST
jgi:hypothetical protein